MLKQVRHDEGLIVPSNRTEGWRWSNLSALPTLAARARAGVAPDALPWLDRDGPRILLIDGRLDTARSRLGPVTLGPLGVSATDHPLARHAPAEGLRLVLGPDHAPTGVVQIIHVATGGAGHSGGEIILESGSHVTSLTTYVGAGWANQHLFVRLAKGARLMSHRRILQDDGFVSLTNAVEVGEGASFVSATLAAGGADSRLDGALRMTGAGAYAEAAGALLARGSQRHDANLVIHHAAPNGTSRQLWRSVADDQAICSVAARVEVARAAQKTDGGQSLKGLLLSRTATINAKPELEIFADDVKCAHGATVGALDREALFYLQSRGVPAAEATALLTRAFVADAVERVGEEAVRAAFYADVDAWFANPSPLAGEGGARREAVGG